MVHANERMLTGGFYAELELSYHPTVAQEMNGRPFGIESLREIQLSLHRGSAGLREYRVAIHVELERSHGQLRQPGRGLVWH